MTLEELARLVCSGRFFVVGELRAADVQPCGYVDKQNGLAMGSLIITYFIERLGGHGYETVRITRRAPDGVADASQVQITTTRGKTYAFEVESIERKPGLLRARMANREPEEVDPRALALVAPRGATAAVP